MDEQPEQWVGKHRGSGSPSDPVLRDSLLAGGQASRWAASYRGASVRVAKPDDRCGDCPALESECGSFGQNAVDERLRDLPLVEKGHHPEELPEVPEFTCELSWVEDNEST
jgi:hypothetical protein